MKENITIKKVISINQHVYNNLLQCYEAEFSRITNKKPNTDGLFPLDTVLGKNVFAHLFYIEYTPIGFIAIKEHDTKKYEVCEFYIIPCFRKQNLGKKFAFMIWDLYSGNWEIKQIEGAEYASIFWRKIISEYTNNNYNEEKYTDIYWGKVTRQLFDS